MSSDVEAQTKIISLSKCLSGFGRMELNQLLSIASKVQWQTADMIFHEGDIGRNMYIICAGKINIFRRSGRKNVSLASLSTGESFGEMALVDSGKRSASAQALEPTLALCICYERLHEAPAAASLLYRNIARELAERLAIANNVIVFQSMIGADPPPLETIGRHRQHKGYA